MFDLTNIVGALSDEELASGYAQVLEALYRPDAYFERCRAHLRDWTPPRAGARRSTWAERAVVLRSIAAQGVRSSYRGAYWRFLGWVLAHHREKLALALAQACAGHHFITYTRETVLPRLRGRSPATLRARGADDPEAGTANRLAAANS